MDNFDSEELRILILTEITRTEKAIEEYREMTKPVTPDDAIGRISRMDAINNKSVTESALREAEQKLRNLQSALNRVGTKDFGVCAKCHNPIPVGRILIRPESRFCVRCAQ
jgi:DnaK suppressor protein